MKQEENVFAIGQILGVEPLNSSPRLLKQGRVGGKHLLRCVAEIRQQRKVKQLIPVGEMMDFQRFDEPLDPVRAREHRGNDDHRAAIGGDAG